MSQGGGVRNQGYLCARSWVTQYHRRGEGKPGCCEGVPYCRRPHQWGRGTFGAASQRPGKGLDDPCCRRNKTPVKVEEAQEGLQVLDGGWLRKIGDGLNPGGKRADSPGGEAVPQKVYLWAAEQTLGRR
jgi:hypothetical protein